MGAFDRIKLSAKDVPAMLRAAFPNYHGRKWYVNVTTSVQMYDTYWSGGTRNQYVGVNLETGKVASPTAGAFGKFYDPNEPTVELQPGLAVVEHSMFMGKDAGITIHVHPANANVARTLPSHASGKRRHAKPSTVGKLNADVRHLLRK